MKMWALPGFLGRENDWDFLKLPLTPVSITAKSSFLTWAQEFNQQVSGSDNILIGYSMGARLALHALLDQPKKWQAAILLSCHPGLKEPQDRLEQDKKWARRFETEPWESLMAEWNAQIVLASYPLKERRNTMTGKIWPNSW